MKRNTIILLVVLAAVGIGAFLIFRKKPARVSSGRRQSFTTPRPQTTRPVPPPRPPIVSPPNVTPPTPPGFSVQQGIDLAATAGCVAATGGSFAPLCGVGAPLAVDFAQGAAKKTANFFSSIF